MQDDTNRHATEIAAQRPLHALFCLFLAVALAVGCAPALPSSNAYAEEVSTASDAGGEGENEDEDGGEGELVGQEESSDPEGAGEAAILPMGSDEAETDQGDADAEAYAESEDEEDEEEAQSLGLENSWRYLDGELLTTKDDGASTDSAFLGDMLSLSSAVTNSNGYTVFNWFNKFSKGYYTGTNAYKGIDVSEHNGTIDWAKVKAAGVDYAIIRCGYGNNDSSQDDAQWVNNVKGCLENGISFGVYLYSYATNTTMATSEASHVLRCLSNAGVSASDLAYPIYLDMEDSSTINSDYASIATTFCNAIKAAGGTPGIYANAYWFNNYLTASCFSNWTKWVAQWNASSGLTYSGLSDFTSGNGMWQFSDYGSVSGISGVVDLDYTFMAGAAVSSGKVAYWTHVQDYGWQKPSSDGGTSGTTGRSKRLEGIKIQLGSAVSGTSGSIRYKAHVQDIGWQDWASNGTLSGTTGQSKRLEAVKIELTGDIADKYDVYYRVHVQDYGWLGWAKNGAMAGTEGLSKRLEAIQVVLCEKGKTPSGYDSSKASYYQAWLTGSAHIQDIGWKSYVKTSSATLSMGTTGKSKRLEGIKLSLPSSSVSGASGSILYRSHIQDIGWQGWKSNGALSGTTGQSKRLEAVQIKLTGDIADKYDVYYRVHVQDYGWLGWAKNGEKAGTEGLSKRAEAIQVVLVKKGGTAPGSTSGAFKSK